MNKVFKFGLRPPHGNIDEVWNQMRLAHEYNRALCDLDRSARHAELAILERLPDSEPARWLSDRDESRGSEPARGPGDRDPEFAAARAAALSAAAAEDAVFARIAAHRAETGSKALTSDLTAEIAAAKLASSEARAEFTSQWRSARKAKEAELEANRTRYFEVRKQLRNEAAAGGLFWSTYQLVEDADDKRRKDTPLFGRKKLEVKAPPYGTLRLPRMPEWEGEGHVSVQLQGGLPGSEVFAQDSQVRIDPIDRAGISARSGGVSMPAGQGKRSRHKTTLWLRLRSDEKRKPVWGVWGMYMHRPLPDDAVIQRATVSVHRIGTRDEWSCELSIITAEHKSGLTCGTGAVGVDIGWRQIGEDLRVALWWGEDKEAAVELRLPPELRNELSYHEQIRSIRDKKFDVARAHLEYQIAQIPGRPPGFDTAVKWMGKWKSHEKMHDLLRKWTVSRFPGDKAAFTILRGWAYRDAHLWDWEASLSIKARRRRLDGYRCWAAELARTYDTLVLEAFNLGEVAVCLPAESEEYSMPIARRNRVAAATSELRECLIKAFRAHGGKVVTMPAAYTTLQCHVTCEIEQFDTARELRHTTARGISWDQDDNAARNLVLGYRESPSDATEVGGARTSKKTGKVVEMQGGKFRRAKEEREAKLAEIDATRKNGDKGSK